MHTTEYQDYYDRCKRADWSYDYSDDRAMYRRGKAEIDGLRAEASKDETKHAIFHGMHAWYWDQPRPECPTLDELLAKAKSAA